MIQASLALAAPIIAEGNTLPLARTDGAASAMPNVFGRCRVVTEEE